MISYTVNASTASKRAPEFSVSTDGKDGQISVESGRVQVVDENKRVQLTAGDLLLIEDNNFIKTDNKSPNYFSWKNGKIAFNDTPISKILKELSWNYQLEINTDALKKMPGCRLTTDYKNMSIEDILKELKEQIGLNYTYNDGVVIVNDINCT